MLLRTAIHPTAVAKKYHSLKKRRIAQNWISYTILLGVLLLLATLAELSCQPNCSWNARFTVFDFIRWRDDFSEEKKIFFLFLLQLSRFYQDWIFFCWKNAAELYTAVDRPISYSYLQFWKSKPINMFFIPIFCLYEKKLKSVITCLSDWCCSITIHFDFYVTSKGQRSPINVCYVGICLKSCNFQDFWQDFHHIQL